MAITTLYNPSLCNTTVVAILKEFIYTYISSDQIDIVDQFPLLDENYSTIKPILVIEDMNGINRSVGFGKAVSSNIRGRWHNLSFLLSWIINDDLGGAPRVRELSDGLQYIFEVYESDLRVANIDKPTCSQMRTIQKTNYGPWFGGRHQVTCRVLVYNL